MTKREEFIIKLENLIQSIKEQGLLITLHNLKKFNNEIKESFTEKEIQTIKKDYEIEKEVYEILEANIKNISEIMVKKNPIIFKLELYKPKFHLLDIEELIVWIYYVNIKQEKLKIDNKKQFYYLIYNFQKAEYKKKEEILLKLLYKIQLYIKHAK